MLQELDADMGALQEVAAAGATRRVSRTGKGVTLGSNAAARYRWACGRNEGHRSRSVSRSVRIFRARRLDVLKLYCVDIVTAVNKVNKEIYF